jgi:hypothetical protein
MKEKRMAEKKKLTTKVVNKAANTSLTAKHRANVGAEKGVLKNSGLRKVRPIKKKET